MTKQTIEKERNEIIQKYGPWRASIPLKYGLWTKGNENSIQTRLLRILQIANDFTAKPINECRVLDLGCGDGQFAIEFALQGAQVIAMDARRANTVKVEFAKRILGIDNLQVITEDVRNFKKLDLGTFDIIICSGLFYHLDVPYAFQFLEECFEMLEGLVVLDTHISLQPDHQVVYKESQFHGHYFKEHEPGASEQEMLSNLLASYENEKSFWFTRPSLINLLSLIGFNSVYENFNPPHINFGQPGIEHMDRCTFTALKTKSANLCTNPATNNLKEYWQEKMLEYSTVTPVIKPGFFRRIKSKLFG